MTRTTLLILLPALALAGLLVSPATRGHGGADHDHEHDHAHPPVNPTQFHGVIPILNVKSVEDSLEHYTQVLGFKADWDWPADQDDKTFASVTNGSVTVFLCEDGQGSAGVWTYYTVANLDALHRNYRKTGADITQAPRDEPWGMREMLVKDLDGHMLRIAQPLPHEEQHAR
ncbi:MAG: hypothetical protein GVY16_12080 [Planctomycetes bacterium]|jgi:uncharacterized glyoxalase superfamily protein PhnB|nr:hypothetical protein [Planctomycetota bacterium]